VQADVTPTYPSVIRERVDGLPARLWTYTAPRESHRSETTLGKDSLPTGGCVEPADGRRGSSIRWCHWCCARRRAGVTWRTWLPHVGASWLHRRSLTLASSETSDEPPIDSIWQRLPMATPAAPVADVYRWNGSDRGPLVARAGPGLGGDTTLTTIDPHLERPITDEIDIGIESVPLQSLRIRLTEIVEREYMRSRSSMRALRPRAIRCSGSRTRVGALRILATIRFCLCMTDCRQASGATDTCCQFTGCRDVRRIWR